MSTWETLGIARTFDEGAIRKAYAARVREWRPDTHPKEFARLREAYELALSWAREAEAGTDPESTLPADLPMEATSSVPAVPVDLGSPATPRDTVPSELVSEAPPPPRETAQAMVSALARCYSESGERAAVTLLHEQHAALDRQTIDARLEWEQALLHSLLVAEAPPVVLLFEADRLLRWRDRELEVSQMFGNAAAQRLAQLLELAWEAIHARHFSRNRWHPRLFHLAALHWFGWAPHVAAALKTAWWWERMTQEPGLEGMRQFLSAPALHRLQGRLLLSTDLLFALFPAWLTWLQAHDPLPDASPWPALAQAAIVLLALLPVPWMARWLWESRAGKAVRGWRYVAQDNGLVWFMAGAVLFGMGLFAALGDTPKGMQVAGWVVVGTMLGSLNILMGYWYWLLVRKVELGLAAPWLWLQRFWSVRTFLRVRDGHAVPGWKEQLRHLPAGVAQAWKDGRTRRKLQAQERAAAAAQKSGGFNWWWVFFGVMVLQAIVRLAK